jgi:predicted metal-binding membrane protein
MAMAGHYMRMGGLHFPWYVVLGVFLASWQVMTAAMMLPASLSTVALCARWAQANQSQRHPRAALGVVLAGFAAVWTAFGLMAFLGDLLLMRASDAWPWLGAHPWVSGAAILATAGAYEFSPPKARCLAACRGPARALGRCAQPGLGAAWRGGLRHGGQCVGSCGALMWLMCGTQLAAVPAMVVLTTVMLAEKALPGGARLTRLVGSTLLLVAAVVLVQPAGSP